MPTLASSRTSRRKSRAICRGAEKGGVHFAAVATVAFILIGYLVGSLSFAVIVSKALGLPDPHEYGSGNPGATNVLRTGNKFAAMLTLAGDAAKGWVARSEENTYEIQYIRHIVCRSM